MFLLFSLAVKGQAATCDCVRWAEYLDTPRNPFYNQGKGCWGAVGIPSYRGLSMWGYPALPSLTHPDLPHTGPAVTAASAAEMVSDGAPCLGCCPSFQVRLQCGPSCSVWAGLLWLGGAPSSRATGWTSSGAESVGSGGFSLTRHGSEENRTMKETSQDICTPFQEGLHWEGPGMEQAVLGKGCPHKNPAYLSRVLATRAPYSPLGREGVPLSSRQRT